MALVAGFVAVGHAAGSAARATAAAAEATAAAAARGDEHRQKQEQMMARLEQLAAKERLNNDEMSEAALLIDTLNSVYGDLGITLDQTTGKLSGVAAAHAKMADAMRRTKVTELTFLIRDLEAQQQAAYAYYNTRGKHALRSSTREASVQAIEDVDRKLMDARAMKTAIESGGSALPEAAAGGAGGAVAGMPVDADDFAGTDKLADIRARVARARIELYEEEHDRAMAMEQLEYDDRVRKSDGSQESLDALLREHELRRQKITQDRDDKLAAEKRREQEKAADEAARAAEQRAEYERRIAEQREDAEIDAMPDARTRELKRLEVDERRELARAAELGADPAAVSALFAARRNLVTAPTASEVRGSSTGTFSAAAAAGMGSGNYASRTAEASEATARFTRRIDMHLAKFGLATT